MLPMLLREGRTMGKPKHDVVETNGHVFCRVGIDLNRTVEILQEFDPAGMHRLCHYDGNTGLTKSSEWKSSRGLARLEIPGLGIFIGTSEYYIGELPNIFQLINELELP